MKTVTYGFTDTHSALFAMAFTRQTHRADISRRRGTIKPYYFQNVPKSLFFFKRKGYRPTLEKVWFGRLEALGRRSKKELDAIRDKMRQLYGYPRYEAKQKHTDEPTPQSDTFEERS